MKKTFKLFLYIIPILILIAIAIFLFNKKSLELEVNLYESYVGGNDNPIYPVLYFEKNLGSSNYDTNTMLLKNSENIELEKHYRTFSKTYPKSAISNNEKSIDENGQLMSYYSLPNKEIYLFDKMLAKISENKLKLTDKTLEAFVDYEDKMSEEFFDLLYFNNYYIFSFKKIDQEYDDFDAIKVDIFSDEFTLLDSLNIDLRGNNLKSDNLVNKSMTVFDNYIVFPVEVYNTFKFVFYDTISKELKLYDKDYTPIGAISNNDYIHLVGYKEDKFIVETFNQNLDFMSKTEKEIIFLNSNNQSNYRFDKSLYMYDDNIYCSLYLNNKNYNFSYNISENDFSKIWELNLDDNNLLLMDIKFMIEYNGEFFDLFPNINNLNLQNNYFN